MSVDVPTRARVVVIGGGIVGASVAYHLAHLGWTDVVVLEQGKLSGGTTWHAAGLVGQLRATESGTRLVQYSASLYETLEQETELGTGFRRCGGVTVARTPDRIVQLQRTAAAAAAYDLECELLTPDEVKQRVPLLRTDDLVGGIWLPGDGVANPTDVTQSLAKGARQLGVKVLEGVRVIGITRSDAGIARVTGVTTDVGDIEADVVVNCAGQWANAVGAMAGVNVPLHSAEHFYVVTEQIDGIDHSLPILRDPDGYTYMKEEVGGLVVGGFEPDAKPWVGPDEIPYPFEFQLLEEDWEHFSFLLESGVHRVPVLAETGLKKLYNGPESFTPDNQFMLGEAPELAGFFVGAGFNSVGIASAGGAGRSLAEWIVGGEPASDLVAVDIRRFAPWSGDRTWLRSRVVEVLGLHYEIPWPNRELTSARDVQTSPVHDVLASQGAVFGSKMGWERANAFAPAGADRDVPYTWHKPEWLAWSCEEQRATREAVGLFDQTSFGKIEVHGPGAEALLRSVCTANLAVDLGVTVYTGMLNARGGYEADVTVTRTADEAFLMVTGSASIVRDIDWLRRHVGEGERVDVRDVTESMAVFGVMGPRSRELLQQLTAADLSDAAFPFSTSQEVELAGASLRATRITYVGELGWELYVPTAPAEAVYAELVRAGEGVGLRPAGYYAINSLRLDMGYRAFGAELTPDYTPFEAGLTFTCDLSEGHDFIGRGAVEQVREVGAKRRLVSVVATDPDVMLWGGELIRREGAPVGQITSAAWSVTLGAAVALAYVWRPDGRPVTPEDLSGDGFTVSVGSEVCDVRVSPRAPHRRVEVPA